MVVYKKHLYIGRAKPGFETRVQAAVLMLAQALPLYHGFLPDVEFVLHTHDLPVPHALF